MVIGRIKSLQSAARSQYQTQPKQRNVFNLSRACNTAKDP